MTGPSPLAQLALWPETDWPPKKSAKRPSLHTFWQDRTALPRFVRDCPVAMRNLDLLGPLDWERVPERELARDWGQPILPQTAQLAAWLVGLNDGRSSAGALHTYLVEHPALIWLLGFPLAPAPNDPLGFNAQASLTTPQHWTKLLRWLPHAAFHFLLADSIRVILNELRALGVMPPDCVSLDTKHILAWVKENNPKTYVADRFNKTRQPAGDPDCRLGCKRRSNQGRPPTATHNPVAPQTFKRGEYYWGYGSGVVVTKVPAWGEFVLAELTQPFDQGDVTYFFPLMQQVEARLGRKPHIGTFDAAFDAWYVQGKGEAHLTALRSPCFTRPPLRTGRDVFTSSGSPLDGPPVGGVHTSACRGGNRRTVSPGCSGHPCHRVAGRWHDALPVAHATGHIGHTDSRPV